MAEDGVLGAGAGDAGLGVVEVAAPSCGGRSPRFDGAEIRVDMAYPGTGRGKIVHPTMTGIPVFARDDVVFVPIEDLAPLPLGLI